MAIAKGGQRDYTIRCFECGTPTGYPAYECPACGGPLAADLSDPVDMAVLHGTGIWRRSGVLPRCSHAATLGEGDTPLVPIGRPSGGPDVKVFAKLESLNPTLSFKDRAMALAASVALDLGATGLMLASTGNAAVSASAYAAVAGLGCVVYAATGSHATEKLATAAAHGATVHAVRGDYSDAYRAAAAAEDPAWLNVTTTYRNPILAEAYRTIAVELDEQLGRTPDVVIIPVGAGPLLRGVFGGYSDLVRAGTAERVPRLIAVQAAACAPLARAWEASDWRASLMTPLVPGETAASAIADPMMGYEREGILTLDAVRRSGGSVIAVGEGAIEQARRWLATRRGLLVEPASACSLAALGEASLQNTLPRGATVVLLLTGHGSKEPLRTSRPAAPQTEDQG